MTKNQQRKALWGLFIGWAILFALGAIFKAKSLIMMAPVFLFLAAAVWGWRTVDTLHEIKKNNKKTKNDN